MLTSEWAKSSFSFANGNCAEVAWRTSAASHANGNCAEVGGYRTSSASYGSGNCAEVGGGAQVVAVRDTKEAQLGEARTVLEFTPAQWRGLLAGIKTGRTARP